MPSDPPIGTPATADQPLAPSLRACLWFDRQAEEAVTFYCDLVPNSRVHEVMRCGPDGPLPEGEVLTAIFTLAGVECMALNGGPMFTLSEAFSFVLECDGQAEIDRYWEALTADGGQESQCGWCKDRFGLSWQIVPRNLGELLGQGDAFQAMMGMGKLDIAALEAAGRV